MRDIIEDRLVELQRLHTKIFDSVAHYTSGAGGHQQMIDAYSVYENRLVSVLEEVAVLAAHHAIPPKRPAIEDESYEAQIWEEGYAQARWFAADAPNRWGLKQGLRLLVNEKKYGK